MVSTALLVGILLVASYTDVRWRLVLNSTTYSGIVVALIGSAIATWCGVEVGSGASSDVHLWGFVRLSESFLGLVACGAAMLVCYVLFAGGVGGGDLKLIAMTGAFLGVYEGLEAMLWTMVLGGCLAVIVLIWRVGVWKLTVMSVQAAWEAIRGRLPAWTDDERRALRTELFLSPSALAAVLVVRYEMWRWW